MDKLLLLDYVEKKYSHTEISKILNISKGSVAHWLKKYGLKTQNEQFKKTSNKDGFRICPICKDEKENKFFYPKTGYCTTCTITVRKEKLNLKKITLLEYKGGKCVKCNLKVSDSHPSVFEFHHLDPKEKDPNYSSSIRFASIEKAKEELDKCILVCANCHRLIHYANG